MEKRVQDYTQDILAVIRSNTSPAAMSSKLEDFHANDLADAMPRLTVQERYKLYRILDINMLSDIFEYTCCRICERDGCEKRSSHSFTDGDRCPCGGSPEN